MMARNTGRGSRYAQLDPNRHKDIRAKMRGGRFGKPLSRWERLIRWIRGDSLVGRIKDRLIARREERGELADDLLRGDALPWDWVLDSLPTCAQPGGLVTGLPARTDFQGTNEGATS